MDELLPDVDQPSRPTEKPARPSKPSTRTDETEIPFPEAEERLDPAPAPTEAERAAPKSAPLEPAKPESDAPKPSTPSGDDDPFKDDPFFNDAAPAPDDANRPNRLDLQFEPPAQPVPANHQAPSRLPAAQLERLPQSRLTRSAGSAQPTPAGPRPDVSRAAPGGNPLRPDAPSVSADDNRVVPTAAWQAEADVAPPTETARNPLR
jgi:hypothetical protein